MAKFTNDDIIHLVDRPSQKFKIRSIEYYKNSPKYRVIKCKGSSINFNYPVEERMFERDTTASKNCNTVSRGGSRKSRKSRKSRHLRTRRR